ncbi:MAG: patatin-like phospholipase family protein [Pseudomonadota bacterium]
MNATPPKIGIALGGGSARGWAHIGVLQELEAQGIRPEIICGTSIGALVGGFYVREQLDPFVAWLRRLDRRMIMRYLDLKLMVGGGLIEGKRLIEFFNTQFGDANIEDLPRPYTAVAADLASGAEVLLQQGSLLEAVRASIALPGLFTPVRRGVQWLVDGGLVYPVPVLHARNLGAGIVIAVNLNSDIAGRHFKRYATPPAPVEHPKPSTEQRLLDKLAHEMKTRTNAMLAPMLEQYLGTPGMLEVIAGSLNIMQDQITRQRLGEDRPEILLEPRLGHIGLLEFDRAAEAIDIGRECVRQHLSAIRAALENDGQAMTDRALRE